MRAIIIDEKECKDLLRRLQMKKSEWESSIEDKEHQTPLNFVDSFFRAINYEVVTWLQDQGYR